MALLEKLSICGVRSFGPNSDEKIKFHTPLTLILGQNGCGKTTIIECLKFALTGDLPAGTGTGIGFVNDPKLSNKRTTKCSVKVRFKDCSGDHITVGKFAEVSLQADNSSMRFKRISPQIRWEDGNGVAGTRDISGRCTDVDTYCSQKLNVSKAILNNVIFCHQENSAWPLDEGKKLKEKFDEIFGSTEYNTCIDKFRKIIADKKNNLKTLKAELDHREENKTRVEKLKESKSEKMERLEQIKGTIEKKQNELKPLEKRYDEILEIERDLNKLCQKLSGFEESYKAILQRDKDLKKYIKEEFQGSDEDLENEIINFNHNQEKTKDMIREMEAKKDEIDCRFREITQKLQNLQENVGKMKAEEDQYKKTIEELNELIEKSRVKFGVLAANEESHMEAMAKLKSALNNEELNHKKLIKEKEMEEMRLQKEINEIRDNLVAAKNNMSSKKETIKNHQNKIDENKQKINHFAHSGKLLGDADAKIKELEEDLTKIKSDFNEYKLQNELDELNNKITSKEQQCNKLEREFKVLQQNYLTEQNIAKESNAVAEKQAEIDQILHKHRENFKVLFPGKIPENNVHQSVKMIQMKQEQKLKQVDKDILKCDKEVSSLGAEVRHTKERLEHSKAELKKKLNRIDKQCKGKSFSEVLNQSYIKKEKLQRDKGNYRSAKNFFDEFIVQFQQESPCCPVCETSFTEKKSLIPNIVKRLKSQIEQLPTKLVAIEKELTDEEELFNQLQQLKPVNDEISKLEDENIPGLEFQFQDQEEKLSEKNLELVALKNDRNDPDKLLQITRQIISDVVVLDRLVNEVANLKSSLISLKAQLVKVSSNRNLNQTELELGKIKADLTNARRQYEIKRNICDESKERVQRIEKQLQDQKLNKMNIEKGMNEQPWMEKEIQDYLEKISVLETNIQELKESIQTLEMELAQAEDYKAEVVSENKSRSDEFREKLENYRRLLNEISKLLEKVQTYEKYNKSSELHKTLKEVKEMEDITQKLQDAKKILEKKIVQKKQEEVNQEGNLRSLKDNEELRRNMVKGKQVKSDMDELKAKIGNSNNRSIMEERRNISIEIESINKEINSKNGEQKTMAEDIKEKEKELNKKENREAFALYRTKNYEVQVEQLTITDLEKYSRVLETSVLQFHQQKMAHVNMTIRDLWRNIYKGNDIDYIEIQTDGKLGNNKRRNYNYKVVQVKKGVELEMRGRCSAGQKVLSCLVIRMALAETFSADCGILSLDEPTTNLDRDNIDSLCDALTNIISSRENQSSFQLVIITHDEDFLRALTRNQSVSRYYRVIRNSEGFSQIQKEFF